MKKIVYAFAVFVFISSATPPTTHTASFQNKIIAVHASVDPIPDCPPDAPDACQVSPDSSPHSIKVGS
jgi:hypothetical protein